MKENKTYWKGLEQLENTADFQARSSKGISRIIYPSTGMRMAILLEEIF